MAIFEPLYIWIFKDDVGAEDEFGAHKQQLHIIVVS
jgi:hypothetical protein